MSRIDDDIDRALDILEANMAKPSGPTPGDWRPSKLPRVVISDCECRDAGCLTPECHKRLCGGHVVAELHNPADVPLIAAAKETAKERDRLRAVLKEICDELYGQGFKVDGWHQNGDLEPLDSWFDDNGWCEAIDNTEPDNQPKGEDDAIRTTQNDADGSTSGT